MAHLSGLVVTLASLGGPSNHPGNGRKARARRTLAGRSTFKVLPKCNIRYNRHSSRPGAKPATAPDTSKGPIRGNSATGGHEITSNRATEENGPAVRADRLLVLVPSHADASGPSPLVGRARRHQTEARALPGGLCLKRFDYVLAGSCAFRSRLGICIPKIPVSLTVEGDRLSWPKRGPLVRRGSSRRPSCLQAPCLPCNRYVSADDAQKPP